MSEMKPCTCCGGRVSTIATRRSGTACPCPLEDIMEDGKCAVHTQVDAEIVADD